MTSDTITTSWVDSRVRAYTHAASVPRQARLGPVKTPSMTRPDAYRTGSPAPSLATPAQRKRDDGRPNPLMTGRGAAMSSRDEPLGFGASNADGRGPFQRGRRINAMAGSRQAGATCEKGGLSAATPGRMPQDNPVGDTRQGRPKAMLAAGTVAGEICELSNEGPPCSHWTPCRGQSGRGQDGGPGRNSEEAEGGRQFGTGSTATWARHAVTGLVGRPAGGRQTESE